jgi:hypothetical protein
MPPGVGQIGTSEQRSVNRAAIVSVAEGSNSVGEAPPRRTDTAPYICERYDITAMRRVGCVPVVMNLYRISEGSDPLDSPPDGQLHIHVRFTCGIVDAIVVGLSRRKVDWVGELGRFFFIWVNHEAK